MVLSPNSKSDDSFGSTAYSQRHALYISYMFAAFGDRMWEFASLIFLMQIFPETLLWASLFGLMETLAAILSGPWVGKLIDRVSRLQVVRGSILGQNLSIASACGILNLLLGLPRPTCKLYLYGGYTALTLLAMIAKISSTINKIGIHKDWVPVLAQEVDDPKIHNGAWLRSLNSVMRRIDLTTSIVAPLVIGLLASGVGAQLTTVLIGVWVAMSMFIELTLVQRVWRMIPQLWVGKKVSTNSAASLSNDRTPLLSATVSGKPTTAHTYWGSWKLYITHPLCIPSVAYCMLYISILNFGGIMVSFLSTPHMHLSPAWVATGRGIAAFVGVVSTIITPKIIERLGLVRTGVMTLWLQVLCLVPTVAAFFISFDRGTFLVILFVSLCSSRFGLWGFDLVETQMMQEGVSGDVVGAVNGTQESMTNIMYLISFLITIVCDDPTQFQYPVLISAGSVLVAAILFSSWAASSRSETWT